MSVWFDSHALPPVQVYHPLIFFKEGTMFGIGDARVALILVIILVIFGAGKLPELVKDSEGEYEFQKSDEDKKRSM